MLLVPGLNALCGSTVDGVKAFCSGRLRLTVSVNIMHTDFVSMHVLGGREASCEIADSVGEAPSTLEPYCCICTSDLFHLQQ